MATHLKDLCSCGALKLVTSLRCRACYNKDRIQAFPERFWSLVSKGLPDQCWEWLGYTLKGGRATYDNIPAARIAYTLTFGEIPDGLWVLHRCDNPKCCTPGHLFLGTAQDNVDDMLSKGRYPKRIGESAGNVKLTYVQVQEIRELYATGQYTQAQIAEKFPIFQAQVSNIVRGKAWREAQDSSESE